MAEDYKGQFKNLSKEYDISIKLIRELDKKGDLDRYLSYLDSLNEDDALRIIRLGGSYNKGGYVKKYVNPVKIVDNLKKKK